MVSWKIMWSSWKSSRRLLTFQDVSSRRQFLDYQDARSYFQDVLSRHVGLFSRRQFFVLSRRSLIFSRRILKTSIFGLSRRSLVFSRRIIKTRRSIFKTSIFGLSRRSHKFQDTISRRLFIFKTPNPSVLKISKSVLKTSLLYCRCRAKISTTSWRASWKVSWRYVLIIRLETTSWR